MLQYLNVLHTFSSRTFPKVRYKASTAAKIYQSKYFLYEASYVSVKIHPNGAIEKQHKPETPPTC
jgi:hypothetical protein